MCFFNIVFGHVYLTAQEYAERMQQDNDASSVVTSSNTGIYDEDENWDSKFYFYVSCQNSAVESCHCTTTEFSASKSDKNV